MQTWQGLFFWKIFCWFCHFCAHMKVKEKLYNQNILFRFYYYIKLSYRKLASFLWLSIVPNKSIKKMSSTLSSPFMRFRIMRFSIYAEVRSSKNDSPFMPFPQKIPHLCGFKNMNFLYFASLFRETVYHCLSLQKSI